MQSLDLQNNFMTNDQFNIQIAAKMTGVNPHTIRAWEKRYQAIVPERDDKGRRVYNRDEVSRLALLNELVYNGHNISSIANLPEADLQSLYQNLFNKEFNFENFHSESTAEPFNNQECLQNLTFALVTQSYNIVNHELDKARKALNGSSLVLNIILPFQSEVKSLFDEGRIDNFQYEVLQTLIRSHLHKKVSSVQTVSDEKIEVLVINSAQSEIEGLQSTLTIESEKFTFQYLGNNLGPEALAILAKQYGSSIILFASATQGSDNSQIQVYDYFTRLKKHLDPNIEVWTVGTKKVLFADSISIEDQRHLKEELASRKEHLSEVIA